MSSKDCKEMAKSIISGHVFYAFLVILIYLLINGLASVIGLSVVSMLLYSVSIIGVYNCFISAYRGNGYDLNNFGRAFKEGLTNRIVLGLYKQILIMLWTFVFIIPGIVKSYSYVLAEFISTRDPNKTASDCVDESRKLMDGHKAELFFFDLSFFGWYLLIGITFGIAAIWVLPYVYQSRVIYIDKNIYRVYNDETLKSDQNENDVNVENELLINDEILENDTKQEQNSFDHTFKYCHQCGAKIGKDANYCGACGAKQHEI